MLKICLTGGPSTGKTEVKKSIDKYFTSLGYKVIMVPEAATLLIESGIRPFGENAIPAVEFQKLIIDYQLNQEEIARKTANILGSDKTLIICDRGLLDGIAYVNIDEWNKVLEEKGITARDALTNYDAIIYMESRKEIFTKENNQARYEKDANEAIEKGEKVLKSYLSHDNLRVVQPREDIEDKKMEVNNIIANMLGLPTRIRNQKKFLVDGINVEVLAKCASKVVIKQDYLKSVDEVEYRLRKVSEGGSSTYHFSIIRNKENGKKEIIKDEKISLDEYNKLLSTRDDTSVSLTKTRYSFVYNRQYFKLDIFADDLCLLEVNLTKENNELSIPDFIRVIDDVTDNLDYKNINIAKRMMTTYGKRENNSDRGNRLFR